LALLALRLLTGLSLLAPLTGTLLALLALLALLVRAGLAALAVLFPLAFLTGLTLLPTSLSLLAGGTVHIFIRQVSYLRVARLASPEKLKPISWRIVPAEGVIPFAPTATLLEPCLSR
jgi:hypothetical protein